ncbi:MAG: DUF6850 family outer membrane beta-barrel protein [Gemmatimonadales bacterium]
MALRLALNVGITFGLVVGAVTVSAQQLGVSPGNDVPSWLQTWSPLVIDGNLPRVLPSASAALPSLLMPAPKTGLFWSAANPAAIPWDIDDSRVDMAAAHSSQAGTFRRPLDPEGAQLSQVSGSGWQPVGKRGALVGRAVFDRNTDNGGTRSDILDPYGSSPFVVADTTTSVVRQTRARLEGAGGWRLGNWGAGLALGYDTRNSATAAAPFARRNRAVQAGATVGILRSFRNDRLEAGASGNWNGGKESIALFEYAQEGFLYLLQGYREIIPSQIDVIYNRRMLNDSRSGRLSIGGKTGALRWVAYGGAGHFRQRLTSIGQDNAPTDEWATTSGTGGISLQTNVIGGRGLLTAEASATSLTGSATQVLPSRRGLDAEERVARARAEIRVPPRGDGWSAVVSAAIQSDHRLRSDTAAKVSTTVDGITPSVSVEIGRHLSKEVSLMGGYAIARYSASGSVPSPLSRGDIYKTFFAPELAIETSASTSQAGSAAIRWNHTGRAAFWIAGRYERLTPAGVNSTFRPPGYRSAGSLWVGVTLADGT